MTRILLLMTTQSYRARAFLDAAARVGVAVTVGTEQEQPLAAQVPGASLALDLRHPRQAQRAIEALAQRFPLDAVVGVDDDTIVLAAMAAQALGLPHNSIESVKASRYKDVMRLALAEADLSSPPFRLVGVDEDPERVAPLLPYPCVVKPLSLAASRGVIRADDPAAFVVAFREVVDILGEAGLEPDDPGAGQVLVEGFIPGREVALEGLLRDGELTVLALFDKPDPLDGPYFEETIYVTPSRLPPETQAESADATTRACAALGLRVGPIHAELRLNPAGAWVVEIAARSIGGLCSRILRFGEGLPLEELIVRQAAGLPLPSLEREQRPAGVMMIPIPRGGILEAVRGVAEAEAVAGVDAVTISTPCGQRVVPLPRATRYLGFIFAHGETPAAVESTLRLAHARLEIEIREEARGDSQPLADW